MASAASIAPTSPRVSTIPRASMAIGSLRAVSVARAEYSTRLRRGSTRRAEPAAREYARGGPLSRARAPGMDRQGRAAGQDTRGTERAPRVLHREQDLVERLLFAVRVDDERAVAR